MEFTPFDKQNEFLSLLLANPAMKVDARLNPSGRLRAMGAFAGKRGGKTEVGAVATGALIEEKFAWDKDSIDPYVAVIAAPTFDMLRRLSWKKFKSYWKKFIVHETKTPMEMYWHHTNPEEDTEFIIYGISADNPERVEGIKASVIWIDEVFQVTEQFFTECLARTADCGGVVICTGSLGVQFVNPKQHWAYKYFKKTQFEGFACIEWPSSKNPYLNKSEIDRLQDILDEQTFKAMFTITWDLIPKTAVYDNWSEANEITGYTYNPALETYISIDWGWSHPMSCGFYQYDRQKDYLYKFDEIFGSKITLEKLYERIILKPFIKTVTKKRMELLPNGKEIQVEYEFVTNIKEWVCDIGGDQEREMIGKSNIKFMEEKFGIDFKRRVSKILKGVAIMRSYIKTASGRVRFFVDVDKCPETIAGIKRYAYPEDDGKIKSENPIKVDDDAVDETRYLFWNIMDHENEQSTGFIIGR